MSEITASKIGCVRWGGDNNTGNFWNQKTPPPKFGAEATGSGHDGVGRLCLRFWLSLSASALLPQYNHKNILSIFITIPQLASQFFQNTMHDIESQAKPMAALLLL